MAYAVHLPSGGVEILRDTEDFQRLVYEHLGSDAENMVAQLRRDADFAYQKTQTDCLSYEESLEECMDAFRDIHDTVHAIEGLLDKSKVNKERARELLGKIKTSIANVY